MVWRRSPADNLVSVVRAQPSAVPIAEANGGETRPLCETTHRDRVPTEAEGGLFRISRKTQRILKGTYVPQHITAAERVSSDSHLPPSSRYSANSNPHVDNGAVAQLL